MAACSTWSTAVVQNTVVAGIGDARKPLYVVGVGNFRISLAAGWKHTETSHGQLYFVVSDENGRCRPCPSWVRNFAYFDFLERKVLEPAS
jgi:nitrogen fixation protein FixH